MNKKLNAKLADEFLSNETRRLERERIKTIREAAPNLLAACEDVELRMTQAIVASSIGKQKNRTAFLLRELERMQKIVLAAIADAKGGAA